MEQEKKSQQSSNLSEELTMKIRVGQLHFQAPSRPTSSSSSIIANIKPLPPGILSQTKTPQKEKIENKPAVNLYNIVKMPMAPPIKAKKKDEKDGQERGLKDKTEKPQKQGLIPLQMATSISGQSLLFKNPVTKISSTASAPETTDKKTTETSMSILKYISVSVKCRRLIYEKENFHELIAKIKTLLSSPSKGELINEIQEKLKDYKETISSEIVKFEEKGYPPQADDNFKEAKRVLSLALGGFSEGVEDLGFAVEEEDMEILEDATDGIEKAFEDMGNYFKIRDKIKTTITSE